MLELTPEQKVRFAAAPMTYASCLATLREAARELGYALALHGSMQRDLDLIAVPWVEEAAEPEALVAAIAKITGGFEIPGENPGLKPHGRIGYSLHLGGGPYIDLSIMPRWTRGERVAMHQRIDGLSSSYEGILDRLAKLEERDAAQDRPAGSPPDAGGVEAGRDVVSAGGQAAE